MLFVSIDVVCICCAAAGSASYGGRCPSLQTSSQTKRRFDEEQAICSYNDKLLKQPMGH